MTKILNLQSSPDEPAPEEDAPFACTSATSVAYCCWRDDPHHAHHEQREGGDSHDQHPEAAERRGDPLEGGRPRLHRQPRGLRQRELSSDGMTPTDPRPHQSAKEVIPHDEHPQAQRHRHRGGRTAQLRRLDREPGRLRLIPARHRRPDQTPEGGDSPMTNILKLNAIGTEEDAPLSSDGSTVSLAACA